MLHVLLKNGDFLNTDISQGSIATCLGCGGVFVYDFVTNFLLSLTVKEFLQEAQLSPSDHAMRLVSSNLANYHATVQKLLIRQVLTKPMV